MEIKKKLYRWSSACICRSDEKQSKLSKSHKRVMTDDFQVMLHILNVWVLVVLFTSKEKTYAGLGKIAQNWEAVLAWANAASKRSL